MFSGKIKYTKEFNNYGLSEWIGLELDLDGVAPKERLSEAKMLVNEFYEESKQPNERVIQKADRHNSPEIDDAINHELRLCFHEIDNSNSMQDCFDISKKYGFSLRPEIKEYISNKFKK